MNSTDFGIVEATISDSSATGGNEVTPVGLTVIGTVGLTEKVLTLNQSIETAPGVYLVGEGDYLEDAAGRLMYLLEDPVSATEVRVSDANNVFTIGACRLWTSNRSNLTLQFHRDSLYIGGVSGSTTEEAISLSHGSSVW